MDSLLDVVKTKKTAYIAIAVGFFIPAFTYPLTSLSQFAFIKQLAFAKKGIFYEPTITEYSLSMFGLFKIPFGYILAFGLIAIFAGVTRLVYLKKNS
jgi:hypothetical protein